MSAVLAGLTLALLAAPGWVQLDEDELRRIYGTRFVVDHSEFRLLEISPEEWTVPYVSEDGYRVFVGVRTGVLEARDTRSGQRLWRRRDMGAIGYAMFEFEGLLMVGSDSNLVAVDQQAGETRWSMDINGRIGGPVARAGSVVILPVRPNALVAVDLEKQAIAWRVSRPTPDGITVRGQAGPRVDAARKQVYAGFSDGVLLALSLDGGKKIWSATLGKTQEFFADVDTTPLLVDGGRGVLAASYNGGLTRLDPDNGAVVYTQPITRLVGLTGGRSGPAIATHGDGGVMGIETSDGAVRWRYRAKRGAPTKPQLIGTGLVAVGFAGSPVALLRVGDGRPVQLISSGAGVSVPPYARGDFLAVMTNEGSLLALARGVGVNARP